MHLDVKNCAQPRIQMLLCEIPGHHLGTHFSHPQFFSQYPTNGFPVYFHCISKHFDCQTSIESKTFSYPCYFVSVRAADGRPLCCSFSTRFLPSENALCQRKACAVDVASPPKACWSFPCVVVVMSQSLAQKKRWHTVARYSVLPFPRNVSTNTSWHVTHLLHTEALQSHATASGNGGRTKVKRCLC